MSARPNLERAESACATRAFFSPFRGDSQVYSRQWRLDDHPFDDAIVQRNQGGHFLRIGRRSLPNHIYHVTTITEGRKDIFLDLRLGRMVVQSLMRIERSDMARTLAFVVMPNHLHWLMQVQAGKNLSATVGSLKSQSGRLIGQATSTTGQVWQKGFYDSAMRRDADMIRVARYIVANPLRAGLAREIGDYSLWNSIWV